MQFLHGEGHRYAFWRDFFAKQISGVPRDKCIPKVRATFPFSAPLTPRLASVPSRFPEKLARPYPWRELPVWKWFPLDQSSKELNFLWNESFTQNLTCPQSSRFRNPLSLSMCVLIAFRSTTRHRFACILRGEKKQFDLPSKQLGRCHRLACWCVMRSVFNALSLKEHTPACLRSQRRECRSRRWLFSSSLSL